MRLACATGMATKEGGRPVLAPIVTTPIIGLTFLAVGRGQAFRRTCDGFCVGRRKSIIGGKVAGGGPPYLLDIKGRKRHRMK